MGKMLTQQAAGWRSNQEKTAYNHSSVNKKGYTRLRPWQRNCFQQLNDSQYSIICSPTGAGKSILIMALVEAKLRCLSKNRAIIVVPQSFISKGFCNSRFVSPLGKHNVHWEPFPDANIALCKKSELTSDNLTNHLINWLGRKSVVDEDINDRIFICCAATFTRAFEKISQMPRKERARLLSNLITVIDEAHHISMGDDDEQNLVFSNAIAEQIRNLYYGQENHVYSNISILLATATFFRGDKYGILDNKMIPSFKRFNLPWDVWLSQMVHLKSFTYDYVFESPLNTYFDCISKCIHQLFRQDKKKLIIYLPRTNSVFAQNCDGKYNEVREIVKILAEKLRAKEVIRDNGLIVLKNKNMEYKILDLVDERDRGKKKDFFAGTDINANRDSLDCIIAMDMFAEGADWQHANGMVIVGIKNSLTDLVQRIGRVLRDVEGKQSAKILQILPFSISDSPNDDLGNSLNNRFKALGAALLMMDVFHPDLVLIHKKGKQEQDRKEKREESVSVFSSLPLDENQINELYKNISRKVLELSVDMKSYGSYSKKAIMESMTDIVHECLDPILETINKSVTNDEKFNLSDEQYDILGKELWGRFCRAKLFSEGVDVSHIDWNMISQVDPIDYLLRFVSQPVDGDALSALRQMIMNSADTNKEQLLIMAKNGEPRPTHKHILGTFLCNYTNKGECYDRQFDSTIRQLAPSWFVNTADIKKNALLQMAKEKKPRPVGKKNLYANALCWYTNECYDTYDPEFLRDLVGLAPEWFEDKLESKKKYLVESAIRGDFMPTPKSSLWNTLKKYTNNNYKNYDKKFHQKLLSIVPHWFEKTIDTNKQTLIEMAKSGKVRPRWDSKIGNLLFSYLRTDKKFANELKSLRSDWFLETKVSKSDRVKKIKLQLIKIAKDGLKRPSCSGKNKSSIGVQLYTYTSPSQNSYDSDFDKKIRKLRPDWFLR